MKKRIILLALAFSAWTGNASAAVFFSTSAHSAEDFEGDFHYDLFRTDVLGANYWGGNPGYQPGYGDNFALAGEISLSSLSGPVADAQLSFYTPSFTGVGMTLGLQSYAGNGNVELSDFNQVLGPLLTFSPSGSSITSVDVTSLVNSFLANGNTYAGFVVTGREGGYGNFYLANAPSSIYLTVSNVPEVSLTALVGCIAEKF